MAPTAVTVRCLKCSRRRQPGQVRALAEVFYGLPDPWEQAEWQMTGRAAIDRCWWMVPIHHGTMLAAMRAKRMLDLAEYERRHNEAQKLGPGGQHTPAGKRLLRADPKGDRMGRYVRLGSRRACVELGPCSVCGHQPRIKVGNLVAEAAGAGADIYL